MGDVHWQLCISIAIFLFSLFNAWWNDTSRFLCAAPISVDSLEGPTTSWSVGETDSKIQLHEHARVRRPVHSGRWSEKFYLTAHGGTFAYVTTPIEMAAVIEELSFSLWVRSDRPGMQLAARVVLPRTVDPETGKYLTLKIYGDSYQNVGRWQQVFLNGVLQKVRRQARIAQSGHSEKVDFREAYIDQIMINIHGGSGKILAYLDDLTSHSLISQKSDSENSADNPIETTSLPPALPHTRNGTRNGPSLPQTIQYQGEPFAFLKKLGFNSILLSKPPTKHQCRNANEHQLWLLAPATNTSRVASNSPKAAGSQHSAADLIWYAPINNDQPTSINFSVSNGLHSRIATTGEPATLGQIATQVSANSAYPLPLQETFDSIPSPRSDLCYWEIREQVLRTLLAGKQQFIFTSRQPLNDPNPSALRRSNALKLILMEIEILRPFISGNVTAQVIDRRNSDMQSTLLKKNQSALIISKAPGLHSTFLSRPISDSYDITVPNISATTRVFLICPVYLRPAHRKRVAGGVQVEVHKPDQHGTILLTNHLPQIRRTANKIAEVKDEAHEVFTWLLKEEERLHRATCESLRRLQSTSQTAQVCLEHSKENPAPIGNANSRRSRQREPEQTLRDFQALRAAQWKLWQHVVTILGPPTRHPALVRFHSLPEGIIWADFSSQALLGANLITKTQGEHTAESSSWWSIVDPSEIGPQKGFDLHWHRNQRTMNLHLWNTQKNSGETRNHSLRIESPRIYLPPGQPYLVQADVIVSATEKENTNRVLVFDSGQGISMGQSFRPGKERQQCIIYRRSPPSGHFSICIAIQETADVWIQNITVRPLIEENVDPNKSDLHILANPGAS